MPALTETEALALWEAVQDVHPVVRPAALLRAAGVDAAERLAIGARDRQLLALRERWFGRDYECVTTCPSCGALVEAAFTTPPVTQPAEKPSLSIEYRLPDTTDLAAIASCGTIEEARARLARRCTALETLDEDLIAQLARAIETADPDGDLRMGLHCPDCDAEWEAPFDPGAFLWRELDGVAARLFREVDALASAYGWTEREILSLSPARRRRYLALVTS